MPGSPECRLRWCQVRVALSNVLAPQFRLFMVVLPRFLVAESKKIPQNIRISRLAVEDIDVRSILTAWCNWIFSR